MKGPEHYREAERLIGGLKELAEHAEQVQPSGEAYAAAVSQILATAQVHATLALAAAIAYPAVKDYTGDEDGSVSRSWADVA